MDKQKLIELQEHYKFLGDIQFSRGNFEEAKVYDELAYAVDLQILELMIQDATIE